MTSLKMMIVVGVLNFAVPESSPPSENLTIPNYSDTSWHSLECRALLLLLHTEDSKALVASLYPGRSHNGLACLFESRLRR